MPVPMDFVLNSVLRKKIPAAVVLLAVLQMQMLPSYLASAFQSHHFLKVNTALIPQ